MGRKRLLISVPVLLLAATANANDVVPSACAPSVLAGFDFNDCLVPLGTSVGGLAHVADDGTGNCVLHLIDENQFNSFGSFVIPDQAAGNNVRQIHVHWRSLVGGDGGSELGADGYSLSWGTDLPNPPSYGNPGEEGAGSGLIVTVDTFDNGGGEAPGLEIKWQGARVAFDNIDPDPGLAKDFLRKNQFVEADVNVDTTGNATFTYDGRVLTATLAGWTGIAGGNFVFGARTGAGSDNHWIDDVLITQIDDTEPPSTSYLTVQAFQTFPNPLRRVGHFKLFASDNCDPDPLIYISDSASGFVAGPFHNGDQVEIAKGPTLPNSQHAPAGGPNSAVIFLQGGARMYSVDSAGNTSPITKVL